jgi:hypothetical protein
MTVELKAYKKLEQAAIRQKGSGREPIGPLDLPYCTVQSKAPEAEEAPQATVVLYL